jgi:hypothetical protein
MKIYTITERELLNLQNLRDSLIETYNAGNKLNYLEVNNLDTFVQRLEKQN